MNEKQFWAIIDSVKQATPEEQELLLGKALRQLSPEEIFAFDALFTDMKKRFLGMEKMVMTRRTSELFKLLYEKGYYVSDDPWEYFLSWLISQGKEVYEQALQQPATILPLIKQASPGRWQLPEHESFGYVALDIYTEKTGKYIFEVYLNKKTNT